MSTQATETTTEILADIESTFERGSEMVAHGLFVTCEYLALGLIAAILSRLAYPGPSHGPYGLILAVWGALAVLWARRH